MNQASIKDSFKDGLDRIRLIDQLQEQDQRLMQEKRPTYFIDGPHGFQWMCSFCDYEEDGIYNYGKNGYACPKCGAVFVSCLSACQQRETKHDAFPTCWA